MNADAPSTKDSILQIQHSNFLSTVFCLQLKFLTPVNLSLNDEFLTIQKQQTQDVCSSNQSIVKMHTISLKSLMFNLIRKSEIDTSYTSSKNFIENFIGIRFFSPDKTYEFYLKDGNILNIWFQTLKKSMIQKGFRENFKPFRQIYRCQNYSTFIVQRMFDNQRFLTKIYSKEGLKKKQNVKENMLNYIKILKNLNHSYFQKLDGVYESDSSIYITFYQVKGMSFQQCIHNKKQFSQNQLEQLFIQLLKALVLLKQKKIIHRDIQLKNIIICRLNPIEITITGFDMGIQVRQGTYVEPYGTLGFAAPQIVSLKQTCCYPNDIYSLGVALYFLMVGSVQFGDEIKKKLFEGENILSMQNKLADQNKFNSKLVEVLNRMLAKNSAERITAEAAINTLLSYKQEKILSPTCTPQGSQCFYEQFGEDNKTKFLNNKERKTSMQI